MIKASDKSGKVKRRAQNFEEINLPICYKNLSFMSIFIILEFLKLL